MIARSWHGRVPTVQANAYYEHLLRTGVADYRRTPGIRGVFVLRRVEGEVTHFQITTLWSSLQAVREFAGPDAERARYYAQDEEFLLEREPYAEHHDVLVAIADELNVEVPVVGPGQDDDTSGA